MIKIKVVEQCPYTVAGIGVMRMSHDVIAVLAGAVYEREEWIALLTGTRSDNGLDISITGLKVPLQERSIAACELARPEPLTDDVVGVIHSHHSMGAFFSQIDKDTLNPRFPLSLVVAQTRGNCSDSEYLLGFSYLAEGRTLLPCGTPGIVQYHIIPTPELPEWSVYTPGFAEPNMNIGLHDCPHTARTKDKLVSHCHTTCGIHLTEATKAVFGRNEGAFIAEVKQKTKLSKRQNNWQQGQGNDGWKGWQGKPHYPGMPVVDNRTPWGRGDKAEMYEGYDDEQFLRHWGV